MKRCSDAVTADSDVENRDSDAPGSSEDTDNHTCLVTSAAPAVRTSYEYVGHGPEVKRLKLVSWTVACDILGGKVSACVRLPLNLACLYDLVS